MRHINRSLLADKIKSGMAMLDFGVSSGDACMLPMCCVGVAERVTGVPALGVSKSSRMPEGGVANARCLLGERVGITGGGVSGANGIYGRCAT